MENRIDDPGLPPAGREPDAGLPEGGPADAGLRGGGPADAGLRGGGPADAGLPGGGPAEAGSAEARPAEARPAEARPEEARPAGQRPVTGEPRVDAALARLDELPDLPVTEHRAVFEHVHRSLSEVLGELDTGLPPGAGGVEQSGNAGRSGHSGGAESRRS
jgi:hypothetical protein